LPVGFKLDLRDSDVEETAIPGIKGLFLLAASHADVVFVLAYLGGIILQAGLLLLAALPATCRLEQVDDEHSE